MLSLFKSPPPFEPPSLPYQILTSPLKLLISHLHTILLFLRGRPYPLPPPSTRIRIVCISDTHNLKPISLPPGDLLIHAGDLTNHGTGTELQDQISWLDSLPYEHKIVIAGNHDSYFDPRSRKPEDAHCELQWGDEKNRVHYLQHSSLTLKFPRRGGDRSVKFYGAPQIPRCGGSDFAFQYPRREDAWSGTVPRDTDVLITHTPPRGHLDLPQGLGCEFLLKEIWRVRPKVHVFGHVHAGHGREHVWWDGAQAAWERMQMRTGWDALDVGAWVEGGRALWYGYWGVIWTRIWGGEAVGGVMVNAALMKRNTGRLGNEAVVVEL